MKSKIYTFIFTAFVVFLTTNQVSAQLVRSAAGADAIAITPTRDLYRADLGGGTTAGANGSFGGLRREINWDGVPDAFAAPNNLPANFFSVNSPRGVVFSTPGTGLQVSATAASGVPIDFGNIDPAYSTFFQPFSAQRLFTSIGSNITDISFFVPGTSTPAFIRGFGSVFSDVDLPNLTSIQYFNVNNVSLGTFFVPHFAANESFSFLGVSFPTAVISRVRITSGNQVLASGTIAEDLVVMDDFIYGEPIASTPILTINKSATQPDPTSAVPIHFTVVFDQDVTGFDASDISFTGSTALGTLVATVTGNGTTYDVAVSGMTSAGNVVASVPAGAAFNSSAQPNTASTSTDNVVFLSGLAPTITCPGNLIMNADPGKCTVEIIFTGEYAIVITGAPAPTIGYDLRLGNGNRRSGSNIGTTFFPSLEFFGGVNTLEITATNSFGTASCSFTVTVVDNQPLVVNCYPDITVNAEVGQCSAEVTYGVSIFDNCPSAPGWIDVQFSTGAYFSASTSAPSSGFSPSDRRRFPVGVSTVHVLVTDAVGITSTCSINITVVDNEKPVITAKPTDVTVECTSQIPVPDISTVTASDNCSSTTITHVDDVISNSTCANKYTVTRTYRATDGSGNTATAIQLITVDDKTPPTITGLAPSKRILAPPNHKMVDISLAYTVNDNCVSTPNVTINITSNEPINGTGDGDTDPDWEVIDDHHIRLRAERSAQGTGRIYTITVTVNDGCNDPVSATTEVVVAHNITGPHSGNAFKVGSTVAFTGEFWDVPGNKHTAKWLIDGASVNGVVTEPAGSKNGKVTGSYKFTTPGVYKLQMNITDQKGVMTYANTNGDLEAIVVIYDPNGGYTYGGGYYNSPAGALIANPSSTGKASYGFAMNYFKNSTNPKGETQFEFKVGTFEFNALNFDYLVINNTMSQFKGTGKIIGGQSGIGFTMTVVDGQLDGSGVDKIRMKIYNKSNGTIIYDNQPGASDAALPTQAVGANSIIVISGASSTLTSAGKSQSEEIKSKVDEVSSELDMIAYPNPTATNFTINIKGNSKTEKITMQVVDMYGRIIETRNVNANSIIRFGDRYRPGIYFVRIIQGKEHKEIKLIKLAD